MRKGWEWLGFYVGWSGKASLRKVTFESRPQRVEGSSHTDIWVIAFWAEACAPWRGREYG